MSRSIFRYALVMSLMTVLAQNAFAATLVNYVNGMSSPSGNPVATLNAATTASSDLSGVGVGGNLGTAGNAIRSSYGAVSGAAIAAAFGPGKSAAMMSAAGRDGDTLIAPAAASLTTDYFQFSVTADPGSTLILSTLGFNLAVLSNIGVTTSGFAFQLYARINGAGAYSAVGTTMSILSTNYTLGTATAVPPISFDVSTLNALGPLQSVEFRLWQGSDLNTDSTLAIAYQDINLQGEVITVPEPSVVGLTALAAIALAARRRRTTSSN